MGNRRKSRHERLKQIQRNNPRSMSASRKAEKLKIENKQQAAEMLETLERNKH